MLSAFERIIMMYFNLYICVSIMKKKWWQPYYIETSISPEGMNKELQMRIQIIEKNVHEYNWLRLLEILHGDLELKAEQNNNYI